MGADRGGLGPPGVPTPVWPICRQRRACVSRWPLGNTGSTGAPGQGPGLPLGLPGCSLEGVGPASPRSPAVEVLTEPLQRDTWQVTGSLAPGGEAHPGGSALCPGGGRALPAHRPVLSSFPGPITAAPATLDTTSSFRSCHPGGPEHEGPVPPEARGQSPRLKGARGGPGGAVGSLVLWEASPWYA